MRAAAGRVPLRALGLVEPELEQNVVGLEGGIGGQFAAPEALGGLQREQVRGGTSDSGADLLSRRAGDTLGGSPGRARNRFIHWVGHGRIYMLTTYARRATLKLK